MADSGEESDRPRTGDIVERTARAVERGSAGLPVGVRVVAHHWREDLPVVSHRQVALRLMLMGSGGEDPNWLGGAHPMPARAPANAHAQAPL